jgi:hypothetical protein
MRVSCYPLKANDHGHTNILLFTQLLRKTSVIDRVKVNGGLNCRSLEGSDPFARLASQLFRLELFFSRAQVQRGENSETQSRQKRAEVQGRPPHINFQQVDG